MKRLSKQQIVRIHRDLIAQSGGIDGLRDEGMLDAALNAPFQTFDGLDLYPGIVEKAVRLGYGLIQNHPFIDGNKRIGTHVMLVFLMINGITLAYDDDDLIHCIYDVASGSKDQDAFLSWVQEHIA